MGRKSDLPLEPKHVHFFAGDWERLADILAPARVSPSVFIRRLVRKKILELEAAIADTANPIAVPVELPGESE